MHLLLLTTFPVSWKRVGAKQVFAVLCTFGLLAQTPSGPRHSIYTHSHMCLQTSHVVDTMFV